MDLSNPVKYYSVLSPNLKDNLLWLLRWVSYGEYTNACDGYWMGLMVNHDIKLLIVMIHQVTMPHEFSTLKGGSALQSLVGYLGSRASLNISSTCKELMT